MFAPKFYDGLVEVRAFPSELATTAQTVALTLSRWQLHPPSTNTFHVKLNGETLDIPYRVYYDKGQLLKCISSDDPERLVALCLGTRHFDGYIREKCVIELLARDEYWAIPFVVQLLGEYVVEIVLLIEKGLPGIDSEKYAKFLRENPKYFETIGRRATSYWDVYYRQRYPKLKEYPAIRAIATLKNI